MKKVRKKQDKKTEDICLDQSNIDINDLDNKIRESVKEYFASNSLDKISRDFIRRLINCKFDLMNFTLYRLKTPYGDVNKSINIIMIEIENIFKAIDLTSSKGEQNGK